SHSQAAARSCPGSSHTDTAPSALTHDGPHVERVTRFKAQVLSRGLHRVGDGLTALAVRVRGPFDRRLDQVSLPVRVSHPRSAGRHIGPLSPPLVRHSADAVVVHGYGLA